MKLLYDENLPPRLVPLLDDIYPMSAHVRQWVRLDARGNKPGVDAQFSLDAERLAFAVRPACGEVDYGVNLADPPPAITRTLEAHTDCRVMYARHLPVEL